MTDDLLEPSAAIGIEDLHPEVQIARTLIESGHFQEAVRKAAERFINRVAFEAERQDMHGVSLMNHVFSADEPVLVFSEQRFTPTQRSLHNGYRSLAVGLTEAVRNVYTHQDELSVSGVEAFEWLGFISAMHRRMDRAEQLVEPPSASEAIASHANEGTQD